MTENFGELLREYMTLASMGSAELAEAIGLRPRTVSHWHEGKVSRPRRREDILACREPLKLSEEATDLLLAAAGYEAEYGTAPRVTWTSDPSPAQTPLMAEQPPPDLVRRPAESEQLIAYLLAKRTRQPVAITTALRGAGGYGKTTLARAVCHDPRVRDAFPDGILWVDLGQSPSLLRQLLRVYGVLTGRNAAFGDVEQARHAVGEVLGGKRCLLVYDGLREKAQLRSLLPGGEQSVMFITTRNPDAFPRDARTVAVDAMQPNEALQLLLSGLPAGEEASATELADRLGRWPLLLRLTNRALRKRVAGLGQNLTDAVTSVFRALDRRAMFAFDARDWVERDRALEATLGVAFDLMSAEECDRYYDLSVFPANTDVPLSTVDKLWSTTGEHATDTGPLCQSLEQLSLIERCSPGGACIRLHGVVHAHLEGTYLTPSQPGRLARLRELIALRFGPGELRMLCFRLEMDYGALLGERRSDKVAHLVCLAARHGQLGELVDAAQQLRPGLTWDGVARTAHRGGSTGHQSALRELHRRFLATPTLERWADLPPDEPYWWLHLAHHLREAGRGEDAEWLLLDFAWLQAKLEATDVTELLQDYEEVLQAQERASSSDETRREAIRLVRGALQLATPVLSRDKTQLASQLWGRLPSLRNPDIGELLAQARHQKRTPWLRPLSATLAQPSSSLQLVAAPRTDWSRPLVLTSDGRRAVAASDDHGLRFWDLQSGHDLQILRGHADQIRAITLFPDDQRAISASDDCTLKLWDLQRGCELLTLAGHRGPVRALALTTDGKRVVSASDDHTLKVWELEGSQEPITLTGHSNTVQAVALTADGRRAVSASNDATIKVWDLQNGQPVFTLSGHSDAVRALALTIDGTYALSASDDHTLRVWDIQSGNQVFVLARHADAVRAVAITPDGGRAVSASVDCTLKVWDLRSGRELHTLKGHTAEVTALALTPDGVCAVSASRDHTLKIWDLGSGLELRTLSGHRAAVRALAIAADGSRAISTSDDRTVKFWDLSTGHELLAESGHTDWVNALLLTPDGKRAVSASNDHTLQVWDMERGMRLHTLTGHKGAVNDAAVSADGARIVSASVDCTVKLWDARSGAELRSLSGHTDAVRKVAVSPDGKRAISASDDGTLRVWDLQKGRGLYNLTGHADWVREVRLTPEGRRAVSASWDCTLKVWDLEKGRAIHTMSGHLDWISALALTPDGACAVSASEDRTLKLWDLQTGRELNTLTGHTAGVCALALSPDGRLAVSASNDHTLKVWDLQSAREVLTLAGHTDRVGAVAFTADGKRVVSVSDDRSLKAWDLRRGTLMDAFDGEVSLYTCAVSPQGNVVCGGEAGRVHFLRIEEGHEIASVEGDPGIGYEPTGRNT